MLICRSWHWCIYYDIFVYLIVSCCSWMCTFALPYTCTLYVHVNNNLLVHVDTYMTLFFYIYIIMYTYSHCFYSQVTSLGLRKKVTKEILRM